jgi:hypothetical protein
VDTRLKERQRHVHLEHPDKSAVAQHSVDLGHRIQVHNTSILAIKTRYMDRVIREAIDIELHPNSMNREVGFCLSNSWKCLICFVKKPAENGARSTRLHRSCTLSGSSAEATGSILTRYPWLYLPTRSSAILAIPVHPACLTFTTDPTPLLSIHFSMWPNLPSSLFLYSSVFSTGGCPQPPAHAGSSLADFSLLKIEAICYSETSVNARSTQLHIPEDDILHSHRCKSLDYYREKYIFKAPRCFMTSETAEERRVLQTAMIL